MAESADLTPKKTASDREFEICRCCAKNISNKSYEKIFLFGIKSETNNIIDLIKKNLEKLRFWTEMAYRSTLVEHVGLK